MIPAPTLLSRWQTLRAAEPRLRQRDAADRLGVTEAELVAAWHGPDAPGVTALRPDWPSLIGGLSHVGRVMALTRNDGVVHETRGVYGGVDLGPQGGIVVGDGIDLRAFTRDWRWAFAVVETTPHGMRHSLQIYDRYGVAVHKVFAEAADDRRGAGSESDRTDDAAATDLDAFAAHLGAHAVSPYVVSPEPVPTPTPRHDAVHLTDSLRREWGALQDTHDFFPMLKRLGLEREEALRLAGPEWAEPLEPKSYRRAFLESSSSGLEIMVFVGNRGLLQIYTGATQRIRMLGDWFNVLDPDFNLHLDERHLARVWRVRKPTRDGVVTSVELFDALGRNLAMVFGARKPGRPELPAWRAVAEGLERAS